MAAAVALAAWQPDPIQRQQSVLLAFHLEHMMLDDGTFMEHEVSVDAL